MEENVRYQYYTAIQEMADDEGWKIVWPDAEPANETFDNEGNYINQDVANETFFIRPQITSVEPDQRGLRGWAKYVWIVQISLYVKAGESTLDAARAADVLRELFVVGDYISDGVHKYKQLTNVSFKPPISMGGWISTPVVFRVSTIR